MINVLKLEVRVEFIVCLQTCLSHLLCVCRRVYHIYCVSADVFITFVATRLQQLYSDMCEAGLTEHHSIGELSDVCWVCRHWLEGCWQEDVTSKCYTITRCVHYYDLAGSERHWYRSGTGCTAILWALYHTAITLYFESKDFFNAVAFWHSWAEFPVPWKIQL
jgi:hypothetical protein